MTNRSWKDIDEIIDEFSAAETVAEEVTPPIVIYRCEQDGYDIFDAPHVGEATYMFDSGERLEVTHLTRDQVKYYVSSGYWKRI